MMPWPSRMVRFLNWRWFTCYDHVYAIVTIKKSGLRLTKTRHFDKMRIKSGTDNIHLMDSRNDHVNDGK